ncbi:exostosin family-domain-containing protein [Zopfochytrium polystomum]|nr:exostosin family-domain-containing protein [Zopfochytrium polystomum]
MRSSNRLTLALLLLLLLIAFLTLFSGKRPSSLNSPRQQQQPARNKKDRGPIEGGDAAASANKNNKNNNKFAVDGGDDDAFVMDDAAEYHAPPPPPLAMPFWGGPDRKKHVPHRQHHDPAAQQQEQASGAPPAPSPPKRVLPPPPTDPEVPSRDRFNDGAVRRLTSKRNAFCVAELPSEYGVDVESRFKEVNVRSREVFADHGYGDPWDGRDPTFRNTNQFALETMFYYFMQDASNPLVSSSCFDADFVFVPLLLVNEMVLNKSTGWDSGQFSRSFVTHLREILPDIDTKPHLIVLGRTGYDFAQRCKTGLFGGGGGGDGAGARNSSRTMWGNGLLCDVVHPNLWFVVLEPPLPGIAHAITAPYPTRYHELRLPPPPSSSGGGGGGGNREDSIPVAAHHVGKSAARTNLVYATFRVRHPALDLRKRLAEQCTERPGKCVFYESDADQDAYVVTSRKHMQNSVFCLQPRGDTLTRVDFWESILNGCIPVVFTPRRHLDLPFNTRLPWHDLCVVLHDERAHAIDTLAQIPAARVARMQRTILRYKHLFQYSLAPNLPPSSSTSSSASKLRGRRVGKGWTLEEALVLEPWDDATTAVLKEFVLRATIAMASHDLRLMYDERGREVGGAWGPPGSENEKVLGVAAA